MSYFIKISFVVLVAVFSTAHAYGYTGYDVGGAGDTVTTRAQYKFRSQFICTAGTAIGKPCVSDGECPGGGAGSCKVYTYPWRFESASGTPVAWLESYFGTTNSAAFFTSTIGGQLATFFGGASGSIFGSAGYGWFGINMDSNPANILGCGASGTGGYVYWVDGTTHQTTVGYDMNGCSMQTTGAQLSVRPGSSGTKGFIIRGASTSPTASYLEIQNSTPTNMLAVEGDGDICINCGTSLGSSRVTVYADVAETGLSVYGGAAARAMFVEAADAGDVVIEYTTSLTGAASYPTEQIKQARVQTTDATPTYLFNLGTTIATYLVEAKVVAKRTDGATHESAAIVSRAGFNVNGSGTLRKLTLRTGTEPDFQASDIAGWGALWVVNGNQIGLRVTGEAGKTIVWQATITIDITYL